MDIDTIPILAQNAQTHFAGPIECIKKLKKLGLTDDRCHLLVEGGAFTFGKSEIHAVYADHGALAPDALSVVLNFRRPLRVSHRRYSLPPGKLPFSGGYASRYLAALH